MLHYNPHNNTLTHIEPGDPVDPLQIPIGIAVTPWTDEGLRANSSFTSGVQFAWDSTSLALYKTCPRKYDFTNRQGWHHKIVPPPLAFGIFIHRIFQAWHQLIALKIDKDTALERCVILAGLLGQKLPSGDTARQKEQLVRATVWYVDQFWDDPAETIILSNGNPAVEYSFTLPFFEHEGQQVYLCGHIDRFCKWQDRVLASDYKSTKYGLDQRFFAKWKPSTQFPLYVAAAHLIAAETQELASTDGLLLDGVQLGVNFNRFSRYIVPFTPEEINEYLESTKWWITQAMRSCEDEYLPANEESCDKFGGCPFREICAKPPARRQDYLRGHFTKRIWDPLKSR